MICSQCGKEHQLSEIELSFRRPDEIAELSDEDRGESVRENSDLCILKKERFFVRGVLPLPMNSRERPYRIGLWVELDKASFDRVYDLWDDPDQANEPAFEANISNAIPLLPSTFGLKCTLQLSGPTSRPNVILNHQSHPLFNEQKDGISDHRAYEYSSYVSSTDI